MFVFFSNESAAGQKFVESIRSLSHKNEEDTELYLSILYFISAGLILSYECT